MLPISELTFFLFYISGTFEYKQRKGARLREVLLVSDIEIYSDTLYIITSIGRWRCKNKICNLKSSL